MTIWNWSGKKNLLILFMAAALLVGCAAHTVVPAAYAVGFDLDDTLLFSTPAFDEAFKSGHRPFSEEFWKVVNSSDRGRSVIKKTVMDIFTVHRKKGARIYIITARHPYGTPPLLDFIKTELGVQPSDVFFETEGKISRIRALGIKVFYGDSDSDIEAALDAGAKAYRILRSPESSYKRNYHPGKYGEKIIEDSRQ